MMANQQYNIYDRFFNTLTPHELYTIMRLRNEVFVVEQNCVYQDADKKDLSCHHLMLWDGEQLAAYARLLPKGLAYEQMSIGRVVSAPSHRRTGAGKLLIEQAIEKCHALFGEGPIRIGAQLYLKKFYASFGFEQTSDMYLEDGIEHVEMIKP